MKTVFVSAGHSNVDPGAVAFGRREADIAIEMRNMVATRLSKAGIVIGTDGTGNTNEPLNLAAAAAKKRDVALEFHCNASNNAAASGCEVLSGSKDQAFAGHLSQTISKVLGIKDRGAKPENAGQHHRLAFVQAGGVIVELFFITNRDDLRKYDQNKAALAKAVADLIISAVQ